MKRLTAIFLFLLMLGLPSSASAITFDWVPRVWKGNNQLRGEDVSRHAGYECKIRNAFGDCIVYSYVHTQRSHKFNNKNYYRRVSSFRGSNLNFSNCNYDDYHRKTSTHTRYSLCDYGELRTYETH